MGACSQKITSACTAIKSSWLSYPLSELNPCAFIYFAQVLEVKKKSVVLFNTWCSRTYAIPGCQSKRRKMEKIYVGDKLLFYFWTTLLPKNNLCIYAKQVCLMYVWIKDVWMCVWISEKKALLKCFTVPIKVLKECNINAVHLPFYQQRKLWPI